MKLSSAPTRWAFTSVLAAAMRLGPTRVPRIAYEVDIPIETCRYYLRKFHSAGFRFLPVVDYRALGLSPHVAFIRFSKQIDKAKRENFLRWLDTIYVVYRAPLNQEQEYILEAVPPEGDGKTYVKMLELLREADVLENYMFEEVVDGYYKPEWVKMYDFTRERWGEKLEEVEIPTIPLSLNMSKTKFDKIDLMIIKSLQVEPTVRMNKISQRYSLSPQLISYHREKHVDGAKLITGFVTTRRTKHEDMNIVFIRTINRINGTDYLFSVWKYNEESLLRLHFPVEGEMTFQHPVYRADTTGVKWYTIPTEHFTERRWTKVEIFIEQLENQLKTIT